WTRYPGTFYTRFKTTKVGIALGEERARRALAWAAALIGVLVCVIGGWLAQRDPRRADGNRGHVSLDFRGLWLMGRRLVRGQGFYLYERSHKRAVLVAAYPPGDENPDQEKSDAEAIMAAMMGQDAEDYEPSGPLYPPLDAFVYAPLGLASPRLGYR